ncbi:MAG: hypothetical protein E7270_10550 [Lachnospiraceae bacterium]|nr:hypothetical protein [Lachnospiraceae bacterium]
MNRVRNAVILFIGVISIIGIIIAIMQHSDKEIGPIEKYIVYNAQEKNEIIIAENYKISIQSLIFDQGTRSGYCELIVESAKDNDKFVTKNYYNSNIDGIDFGINSYEEMSSVKGIEPNIESRIDGEKTHVFFKFKDETYNDSNNENKLQIYSNENKELFGDYVLEDTDGVVRYVECIDGSKVYITDDCIRIDGDTWTEVIKNDICLVYKDGIKQDVIENQKLKAISSSTDKDSENASTFIEYEPNQEVSNIHRIRIDEEEYEIIVENVK